MRTRLSVCRRKRVFASAEEARAAVVGEAVLLPYRCDRCGRFHFTSRLKGKRVPRPAALPS
ncbi:hypothetical protein DBR17_18040 [Sphingomonas sp. HMWF008]|nr:hypothetical protein DBR17_18040 [Sphingomonas sp. HMWF008]